MEMTDGAHLDGIAYRQTTKPPSTKTEEWQEDGKKERGAWTGG